MLTDEEERSLSDAIRRGAEAARRLEDGEGKPGDRAAARAGLDARDRFIRANIRLVVRVARSYPSNHRMDLQDLVQEGLIGLARAVDKFDGRKGFKFSTYAIHWVRQSISRALDSSSAAARIPEEVVADMRRRMSCPSGLPPEDLSGADHRVVHLMSPVPIDEPDVERRLPACWREPPEDEAVDKAEVARLLDGLSPAARDVVVAKFGLAGGGPVSYRRAGELVGVSGTLAMKRVKEAILDMRAMSEGRIPVGSGQAA